MHWEVILIQKRYNVAWIGLQKCRLDVTGPYNIPVYAPKMAYLEILELIRIIHLRRDQKGIKITIRFLA